MTAPAGPRTSDLLAKVEKPLLVLWGDADPWTPINGAKVYEDASKTKNIQVIPLSPGIKNLNIKSPLFIKNKIRVPWGHFNLCKLKFLSDFK